MKAFYGSRFSTNMTKTPEGFLVCHNVPIARTGWYEYLAEELGIEDSSNKIVNVYRSPDEVFSKAAIASFESKPVTDEHPPELIGPGNSSIFIKGTTQNVRQDPREPDLLIADLVIYDETLINEIVQGKREVSCGYECSYKENKDGTYSQVSICGNHVAVVQNGRAGDRVAIRDSQMKGEKRKMAKKKATKKFLTALGLKHFISDAEPDEIADVVDEMTTENEIEDEDVEATEANDEGNSELAELKEQVIKLTEMVNKLVQDKEAPENTIDQMINDLENTVGDEEESVTVPVEEMSDEDIPEGVEQKNEELPKNPVPNTDTAAILLALKTIKPIIASISNPGERKKACDSVLKQFNSLKQTKQNKNGYAEILKAQRLNMQTLDSKIKADEMIGEKAKKMFNPHYKEVK